MFVLNTKTGIPGMPGIKLITIDGLDCIVFHFIALHRGPRTKYNAGISTKKRPRDSYHHHCIIDVDVNGGGVLVVVSREIQ